MSKTKVPMCWGTLLHANGGEVFSPSHVYVEGMASPDRNAGLVSTIDSGGTVDVGVGCAAMGEGVGCADA
jgi:hypothetical protein